MPERRLAWPLAALVALIGLATWGLSASRAALPVDPVAPPAIAARSTPRSEGVRWILAGGGPTPELNQVQIEQDLLLARDTLSPLGDGLLLYAGGADGNAVQVLREGAAADPLRARLAELFDPRGGRDSSYRPSDLSPAGAASAEAILEAVRGALGDSDAPLTVYLAGHGVGGEEPHLSQFLTWGADDLTVDDLAATLDEVPDHRPARFVVTACYAGGFAEIAFTAADPEEGPAASDRCGFFATTWDRAAAGCDPNPDRGAQEGYGIHFLHALRGEDREGDDALDEIDLDGDGVVTLLEAHARARIASGSLDVPVTTSERFLRAAAVDPEAVPDGELPPPHLPVERAVVAALAERLGLDDPRDVSARLDALHERADPLAERLDELEAELERVREVLAAELLHRWPVLDDPWHPDFGATLAAQRDAIEAHLETSGAAAHEAELLAEHALLAAEHDDLLADAAPMERLERALETLALAAQLQAEGGTLWLRYLRFVACESGRL
ncbi:MAG: hypothetical protein H6719_16955 [Sandaracinaceae bacterium]|nr:hypothetical protein [Sandaracinaceae bacterium]